MKNRRTIRRIGILALAVTAGLATTAASAVASPATHRAGAISVAPTAPQGMTSAGGHSTPCFTASDPTDCLSSDPRVTVTFEGGDSGCVFAITMKWGDGTKTTKPVNGVTPGALAVMFTHTYDHRGTYTLNWVSVVTGGDCYGNSGTQYFTLAKITGTERLATLGDSYSSGEGAGDYYPGTDSAAGCHRSPHAWALQLGRYLAKRSVEMPSLKYFLACSGAVSSALLNRFKGQPAQIVALHDLTPKPTLITLTMGGNDLGFADVVADCYKATLRATSCIKNGTIAAVKAKLPAEEKILASDYDHVYAADPNATLLIVGYPRIFEEASHCGGITTTEEKALNVLTGDVDAMIARAAARAGSSYVPDLGAFTGHEMCTRHPWVYEIGLLRGLNDDQQQAHPNALGQGAIARDVAAFINTHL
jgi:lysophospholipase L1-like esterase